MKIVVVGGGGFVGHHLVKRLNDLNHEILVLDCGVEGYNKNNVINSPNVLNIIDNNYDTLTHLLDFNPDLLINLASLSHVDTSINSPQKFIEYNITRFHLMLEGIRQYQNLTKSKLNIIHMSTDEVFGSIIDDYSINEEGFIHKQGFDNWNGEYDFYKPSSIYSISKNTQEQIVNYYKTALNFNIVTVRATNIFGTHQDKKKLIPVIINNIKHDIEIPVYGQGNNKRTWLYTSDLIDFYEVLINKMLKGQDTYSVYNVSNYSNEVSNLDLINFIGSIMNKEPKIKFVPDRLNHDYRYSLSYNNALRHGWFPQINLKQGLKEIVEYYENQ